MTPDLSLYRLTSGQKWQLALSVFVVYWPIRLYVNISSPAWALRVTRIPFYVLEILLSLIFFFLWISITEWIQRRLFGWFGNGFLLEFRVPAQLATLLVASVMALGFNFGFYTIARSVNGLIEDRFPAFRALPPPRAAALDVPIVRQYNREQRARANNGLTVMALLSAFYLATNRRTNRRLQDVQLRAERLEKEALQAQFAALKSQVNPHFLFNSLSILSSLVHADAELSERFIDQLSKAYRYILEQKDNERVPLKTELAFIQAYRFLLNIRFENKFDIAINVSEEVQQHYNIAPLTLQLLVENAVKHNRMSAKEPLQVQIFVAGECLVVQNNRQLRPQSETSTGVGLQNIVNRYALLTDRPVHVQENEEDFVVKIPLI